MRYRVRHTTTYQYPTSVSLCHNVAHLLPRDTPQQRCISARVQTNPTPAIENSHEDYFGNKVIYLSIQSEHSQLVVDALSEVEMLAESPSLDLNFGICCADALDRLAAAPDEQTLDAREYVLPSPLIGRRLDGLAEYARPSFHDRRRPLVSAVSELIARIHQDFQYDSAFTTLTTPLAEVLEHRRGVCQDFAHLGIGCVRTMGFPARYVSGYIETLPPPGQPKLVGADESHAWLSVYIPDQGWVDFDPTNNLLARQQHITVAWGRDYTDVTPLRGVIFGGGGGEQKLSVSVSMEAVAK